MLSNTFLLYAELKENLFKLSIQSCNYVYILEKCSALIEQDKSSFFERTSDVDI